MRCLPSRFVGVALFGAIALAAGAKGQNAVVTNAEFDDANQDTGWFSSGGDWISDDDADGCHSGASASGSLGAPSIQDLGGPGNSGAYAEASDCLTVQPGEEIFTQIAYVSPFPFGVAGDWFDNPNCEGSSEGLQVALTGSSTAVWALHDDTLTVPVGRFSMRVAWAAFDIGGNSSFDIQVDRAYLGRRERIFSDDFDLSTTCRWTSSVGGADEIPPSDPGAIVSSSHDGGAAPPPILLSWGASVDAGGSGLATYRGGVGGPVFGPVTCDQLTPLGLTTQAQVPGPLPDGDYYAFVCAEDNAGNQSGVTMGGPYTVVN